MAEQIYHRNSSKVLVTFTLTVPVPAPAPAPTPEVLAFFAYNHVEFCGNFIFARENEAEILENYLERLQRWIYLNNFRPLACLKALPFFQQQTVKRISQNILLELFSIDRDTRLKALLSDSYFNANKVKGSVTAKAVTAIILTYFDIPLMRTENDDDDAFCDMFGVLFGVLCSSSNLFLCDFMLHHLTSSGTANEIISKHDLDTLLKIDTSIEDTRIVNFLNKEFMQPIERKRPGFVDRMLFGRKKNVNLAIFKYRAETILKDVRYFQTILTNIPDNNDDGNNGEGNNEESDNDDGENDDGENDDDNSDEEDESDRRIKERFDSIQRRWGAVPEEEFEFSTPISSEYPNIRREEQLTDILNPVGEERDVEEGEVNQESHRHHNRKYSILEASSAPMTFYLQAGASGNFSIPEEPTRPQVERRLSWPLAKPGSKISLKLVDNRGLAIEDEIDQNVLVYGDVPSPTSEVNDREEIRSMVSGDYESEPSSDQMSLSERSISPLIMSNSSIERLVDDLMSRGRVASEQSLTDPQLAPINEMVENWMDRNTLAEETGIPRAVDIDEEILEFLGIDYYDREGFDHYFVNVGRAKIFHVLELRSKMDIIKQAFINLTSDTYVDLIDRQVSSSDVLPEGEDMLKEVQLAYKEMVAQYVNYQRLVDEFERRYALLRMLEFVNDYIPRIMLLIKQFRPGSALGPPDMEGIYGILCDGTQAAASLKHTWETYVESSRAFKKIRRTYQDSIDNLEQEFFLVVDELHRQSSAYLGNLGTEEDRRD
ncbi:hypothetical protein MFLAVUS_001203 [Mucor flavus]|uniref:Uncharacterized protein n=1 Tax=Mucor flavus TaxID=439312 RepID=A0ABP9YLT7_9FUNG